MMWTKLASEQGHWRKQRGRRVHKGLNFGAKVLVVLVVIEGFCKNMFKLNIEFVSSTGRSGF